MTTINFDEVSGGNVTANTKAAFGVANNGTGEGSIGILGMSNGEKGPGVSGLNFADKGWGVYGGCQKSDGYGVIGQSDGENGIGVWGVSFNVASGTGVYGLGAKWAGYFQGNVAVTGDISLLGGGDCAEEFDIVESEKNVEAGTVMVLNGMGSLQPSYREYDKKVAGIVSGAGGYKPAFILNRYSQSQNESQNKKNENKKNQRLPIALMGKVYCKVDARNSPIEIGDLLTTSSKKGYAMKVDNPMKAFGAVIGKSLGSIKEGLGMIPVLVALQ